MFSRERGQWSTYLRTKQSKFRGSKRDAWATEGIKEKHLSHHIVWNWFRIYLRTNYLSWFWSSEMKKLKRWLIPKMIDLIRPAGTALLSGQQMDFAEVVSIGILTLATAAASALTDTYSISSTLSGSHQRWVATECIRYQCRRTTCTTDQPSSRTSTYIQWPSRKNIWIGRDSWTDLYWSAGASRLYDRLKGLIVSKANACLHDGGDLYFLHKVKAFSVLEGTSDYDSKYY